MSYSLGVDLGTTFVAAALGYAGSGDASSGYAGRVEMFTLGDRSVVSPATVYLREDGALVTGEAASLRAVSSPDRVCREIKRRLGNPTPVILGGQPRTVTALLGALLRDVVARVTETEGTPPDRVMLTHPANWGPFRRALFDEVPQHAGLQSLPMVTEPEAAAAHYAASRQLADGQTVAVYDLGGGTFDATVLRKQPDGVEILGTPEGIERLGGVDFDEAILSYVDYAADGALRELDMRDPQTIVALARLRQDCILAKEALSVDTETVLPVFLPHRHFDVRITRSDFEDLVRAQIESTITALSRTLASAQVEPAELSAVLLVGGSSRIPLVARMVSAELGRPTVVDAHPKYVVALGAATLATRMTPPTQRTPSPVDTPSPVSAPPLVGAPPPDGRRPGSESRPGPPDDSPTPPDPARALPAQPAGPAPPGWLTDRGRQRELLIAAGALVAVISLIALVFLGVNQVRALSPSGGLQQSQPEQSEPASAAPRIVPAVAIPALGTPIQVGKTPRFVAVSPSGRQAYVANGNAQVVTVVDTAVNQVTATIPIVAGPPQFLAFSPDGRRLYVTIFNDQWTIHVIDVVDTASNTVIATIPQQARPFLPAVTPDGKRLYVPNHDIASVAVVATDTNKVIAEIKVAPNPHWVAFSRDGARAYTANHESNVVSVIDTSTLKVVTTIPVGISPHALAVSPDLPLVANVNYDASSVNKIDTATNKVIATIPVGRNPRDIAWAPDGRFLYTVNEGGNSVSVIEVRTHQVTATIPTGGSPTSIALLPNGRHAYVSNSAGETLTVLELGGAN